MQQSILAVDDEPHMLTLLERIITEKTKYHIRTTSNSLEVPDLLEENVYDLIISDLKMPGLDGLGILRYISEHNRSEVVVLITAFGTSDSATEARSLGVFDYITKPFKKEQILTTVERVMRCQRDGRAARILTDLTSTEPYDKAVEKFQQEYLQRLVQRHGSDPDRLAEVSGLSVDLIKSISDGQA